MTVNTLHIAENHPSFAGHFPGYPILPGALLLEEALHEIALARRIDLREWQVSGAKFLHPVKPGAQLVLEHTNSDDATIRFTIVGAGIKVLSGTLSSRGTDADGPHGA